MLMHVIDLNGQWSVKSGGPSPSIPPGAAAARRWMEASVPGVIHTDLLNAGVIPDPFIGTNENQVQWVADVPWVYRRTFDISAAVLKERRIELVAEGLDTVARIRINGRPVGTSRNMFTAARFEIRRFLRPGTNSIEVRFESPVKRAKAEEKAHGRLQVELEPHRVHIRKAQYSFGWDWGPRLTTSGIWRPIRIEAFTDARLRDPFVRVKGIRGSAAALVVSAAIDGRSRKRRTLRVRIEGHGARVDKQVVVSGRTAQAAVTLDRARLWWPNGHGDQPMYTAELTLFEGSREVDTLTVPFAVRTVRLVQKPDSEGRSFLLEINTQRLFCKGADWIPADSFLPRVSRATYERLLTLARDASMNMIRVWGGGIYEDDAFYDLCDRLGLMVWQDFMYACAEYPDHPAFLKEAGREAEVNVRRLRNHPSIVLWCGNNECEWIFCRRNPGTKPDDMRGTPIFKDVLPRVVRRCDGTRPYWRSTPFGTGFPNDQGNGNHHQWAVWSEWKDFRGYEENTARFVSEFGFQGPANRATMERALGPRDRNPQSPVMEHHNKQVEGPERLFRFIAGHFAVPRTFGEFIHTGQVLQAEALKCGVEHWRRRKFRTAGALFWQLNDCWPVTSWAVIDSDLQPKAAYYYAKRFFAPVLVSVTRKGDALEVWGTNDTMSAVRGRLYVALSSVKGETLWKGAYPARIPPNASAVLRIIPGDVVRRADPRTAYVRAELRLGRRAVTVNRYYFSEFKHLDLGRPDVGVSLKKVGREKWTAVLTSSRLAPAVALSSRSGEAEFPDNFMTLDPGRPCRLTIQSAMSAGRLRRDIVVRSLT